MKKLLWVILIVLPLLMNACGPVGSDQVPVADLPDPAIYALQIAELPEVGFPWQQTYNQTDIKESYKWAYQAFQAYQPGNFGIDLESGFAVNNDVVLYENNVSREDLPQPPDSLGEIQGISWKSVPQAHRLGDKSALWKTTIGDMLTPAWWLEFYKGHAYVRISLFGFPDQIASAIIYGLGDIVAERLPRSSDSLRSDSATQVASQPPPLPIATPRATPSPEAISTSQPTQEDEPQAALIPISYIAPPGETGMVSFTDETGNQLTDSVKGTDDILEDQGSGTAYEWVGWTDLTDPVTLTFTFDGDPSISSVEIGFNHRDGLGIFLPTLVTINGVDFQLSADEVLNNQRGDIVFNGPFNSPVVQVVLHHRGRGWILVDEIHFSH
jgi:hypothetical protein